MRLVHCEGDQHAVDAGWVRIERQQGLGFEVLGRVDDQAVRAESDDQILAAEGKGGQKGAFDPLCPNLIGRKRLTQCCRRGMINLVGRFIDGKVAAERGDIEAGLIGVSKRSINSSTCVFLLTTRILSKALFKASILWGHGVRARLSISVSSERALRC